MGKTADSHDLIRVHGARENNLKDVDVELPKRLINETYSAFVQGFMPTLARPEVDVLEGLTTAIIVDQQRMGADPRSTVGTATDTGAMLRILFSRGGDDGARRQNGERTPRLQHRRRHVPALRGPRLDQRYRPDRAVRRPQVTQ